jgi:hypothetical protein
MGVYTKQAVTPYSDHWKITDGADGYLYIRGAHLPFAGSWLARARGDASRRPSLELNNERATERLVNQLLAALNGQKVARSDFGKASFGYLTSENDNVGTNGPAADFNAERHGSKRTVLKPGEIALHVYVSPEKDRQKAIKSRVMSPVEILRIEQRGITITPAIIKALIDSISPIAPSHDVSRKPGHRSAPGARH